MNKAIEQTVEDIAIYGLYAIATALIIAGVVVIYYAARHEIMTIKSEEPSNISTEVKNEYLSKQTHLN